MFESQSRKEREEQRRRDDILGVAERLFAHNGYHETSVADIAKEAEFGVGTIYKYFNNKETLFRSLLNERLTEHQTEFGDIISRPGPVISVITRLIEMWVTRLASRLDFYQLYITYVSPRLERGESPGGLDLEEVRQHKCEQMRKLTELFQRGIDSGELKDIGAAHLASALNGIMIASFFNVVYGQEGQVDAAGIKKAITEIYFHGVLGQENRQQE